MHAFSRTDHPLPGTRAWFVFFLLWMSACAGVALLTGDGPWQNLPVAAGLWAVGVACFYLSLCNSFTPMPTAWVILLLAASPGYAPVETPWARVLVVTLFCTTGTVIANLTEYHLLAYLCRLGLGKRVRRTRLYGWAIRWFDHAPFQFLTLIAFVPLPVDAVRWLAVLRGYSRRRFALAYFIGRGPRYLLFSWFAVAWRPDKWTILWIQAGLLAVAIAARLGWRLFRRHERKLHPPTPDEETTLEAAAALPNAESPQD
jgi:membrane protein YqaA with SNARE-associated domain